MSEKPFILDFDSNEHAVIEPNHDQFPFKFHGKLVYAFVPKEDIGNFLKQIPFLFSRMYMKLKSMVKN